MPKHRGDTKKIFGMIFLTFFHRHLFVYRFTGELLFPCAAIVNILWAFPNPIGCHVMYLVSKQFNAYVLLTPAYTCMSDV